MMTRMVKDKAFALLTQSVADIVGQEDKIASALFSALKSGDQVDMMMARASFEDLDSSIKKQINGHALRLAGSVH